MSSLFSGGVSTEDPPVPIPNTEVKLSYADGTALATKWESREPPELYLSPKESLLLIGLFSFAVFFVSAFAVFSRSQARGNSRSAGVRHRCTKSPFLGYVGCVFTYSKLQAYESLSLCYR